MYVDDCLQGTEMLMNSDVDIPLNIGSSELIAINDLYKMVAGFAGIEIEVVHDLTAPQGIRGHDSDNTLIKHHLGWEPSISLEDGTRDLRMDRTASQSSERAMRSTRGFRRQGIQPSCDPRGKSRATSIGPTITVLDRSAVV